MQVGAISNSGHYNYHSPTASLLVLSDESKKVLEINSEGLVTDRMYLNTRWAGLAEDIP